MKGVTCSRSDANLLSFHALCRTENLKTSTSCPSGYGTSNVLEVYSCPSWIWIRKMWSMTFGSITGQSAVIRTICLGFSFLDSW